MAPARGDDKYQTFADRQFVQKALTAGGIVVTETFSPRNARPWSREIRFSTAGLEQALRTPLKNCGATLIESVSGTPNRKKDFLTSRPHCTTCPAA